MTSKSSFLASVKENSKRRLWVWVLSVLAFMLALPVYTALVINKVLSQVEWYILDYGKTIADQYIAEQLPRAMQSTFGSSSFIILAFTCILAVICAIQGYSWLYSRKKIDFYMGMPVKRKKRYFVVWMGGILAYVIPYLLGLVISILIAAVNHGVNGSVIVSAIQGFVVFLCLFLAIYHMAILALMLTGNIIVTAMGFLVFCLYEIFVRYTMFGYQTLFFKYNSYYGKSEAPIFSPFSMYYKMIENVPKEWGHLLALIVFAVVLGVVAYVCYLKRPSEAAGKAMTYEFTKPLVKILVVVLAALMFALIIANSISFNPEKSMAGIGYIILTMAIAVIVGCAAIQVIYDFDIKGALHKKCHIVISGILVALIFMSYRYDFFHYNHYIPEESAVESVAFVPGYYDVTGRYGTAWFDDYNTFSYMNGEKYASKYMYLTNISDIRELVKYSMEEYDKIDRYSEKYNGAYDDSEQWWSNATLIYRLKNGREVSRNIWVNVKDAKTCELLNIIMGSEEFKQGYMMGASDTLINLVNNPISSVSGTYGNTVYQSKMSKKEISGLLEEYKKDLLMADFTSIQESMPISVVGIMFTNKEREDSGYYGGSSSWEVGINIYPIFENSISYLKEHGYYLDSQVDIKDIAQIRVANNNYDIINELRKKQKTSAGAETIIEGTAAAMPINYSDINYSDFCVYAEYSSTEDIEKIAECIYPNGFCPTRWDGGLSLDSGNYDVVVYFKPESKMAKEHGACAYYNFIEGAILEFVQKDTAYKE